MQIPSLFGNWFWLCFFHWVKLTGGSVSLYKHFYYAHRWSSPVQKRFPWTRHSCPPPFFPLEEIKHKNKLPVSSWKQNAGSFSPSPLLKKGPIRGPPLAKGYGTGTLKWGFNEVACERMEGTVPAVQMALCHHWHLPSACLSKWCWRGHRELPICYTASTGLQWPRDPRVRQVQRVCSFSSMGSSFSVFTASSQPQIFTAAATAALPGIAAAAFSLTRLPSPPPRLALPLPSPSSTPQPRT